MRILGRTIGSVCVSVTDGAQYRGMLILKHLQEIGCDMAFVPDGMTSSDLSAIARIYDDAYASDGGDADHARRFMYTLNAYFAIVKYMCRMRDLALAIGAGALAACILAFTMMPA